MDLFGKTLSNLISSQFPEHYREHGPLFVAFVTEYYKWLETQTPTRDEWFVDKVSLIAVRNGSANVVGKGTFFETQFESGDSIAISKGSETTDYEMYTVRSVANNTRLTLTEAKVPNFNHANTRYTTVSDQPNALFLTRNFPELHDIDETLDEYVIYFKEKYLKNLQFRTITDTKTLIKHSLDLYRSKGTERSIDLLYKIAFGKPASVYYPGQDIFRLSSGDWHIPKYLELSLNKFSKQFINRQIVGVLSGASAFVEEIIRRISGSKIIEVAYISAINGSFITGEKVTLSDFSLAMADVPTVVGSLNELEFETIGSGSNFTENEIVEVESVNGRGAIGKVLTTSDTSGQLIFELNDGGYGYTANIQLANTTGNVAVVSGNSTIVGTGTLFDTEYSVGDFISLWSNTIAYDVHEVDDITNSTVLEVTTAPDFSNAVTKAAFTRYFAQTFVSEKILTISNATFDMDYFNFEYTPFLEGITQPIAMINYENSNGDFTTGEHIFTYNPGPASSGEAHILSVTKKTTTSGILTVAIMSGDLDEPAIYTTANAIGANLAVANGYHDMTATANVIGNYSNVVVTVSTGNLFIDAETITQPETGAQGVVSGSILQNANTECVVSITSSEGIFKNGFIVTGATSGTTGLVTATEIRIGVINISNTFFTIPNNHIRTSQMEGTVTEISLGSGAAVTFSNNLIYTEEITYATDYIQPYLTLNLGGTTWPFPANLNANLTSMIGNTLSYASLTVGKVSAISATSPGEAYNKVPIIRLHEPTIFNFDRYDTITLTVTDTDGFNIGEIITQVDTGARGLIKEIPIVGSDLVVQNMRWNANDAFVITSNTTTKVMGESSGFEANVTIISEHTQSNRFGSDVSLLTELSGSEGSITSVKVLDSGFGFANGEVVNVVSGDKEASGYAVLHTHGTGSGYYRTNDGFLSDVKKLSDGYYWQEYSYEVRSSVIDDFKKLLKNIVHPAGTKYFDALIYDSINETAPTVENTITIS